MDIVMLHGLGRSPLSMRPLGQRLRRQGHTVHYFGYYAFCQSFDLVRQRFIQMLRRTIGTRPYALISHSFGGIVIRASLPDLRNNPPRHVVMLGPPNHPSSFARGLRDNPLFWLYTWDCGHKAGDEAFYATLPLPTIPTTIIAGTAGPRGRFSPFGSRVNDGIVTLEEAHLGDGYPLHSVNVIHLLLMNSRQVAHLVGAALKA